MPLQVSIFDNTKGLTENQKEWNRLFKLAQRRREKYSKAAGIKFAPLPKKPKRVTVKALQNLKRETQGQRLFRGATFRDTGEKVFGNVQEAYRRARESRESNKKQRTQEPPEIRQFPVIPVLTEAPGAEPPADEELEGAYRQIVKNCYSFFEQLYRDSMTRTSTDEMRRNVAENYNLIMGTLGDIERERGTVGLGKAIEAAGIYYLDLPPSALYDRRIVENWIAHLPLDVIEGRDWNKIMTDAFYESQDYSDVLDGWGEDY